MTSPARPSDVTVLLGAVRGGDRAAFDDLLARLYVELRSLAEAQLRRERGDHTLHATDLVHEAYLKLVDQREANWQGRAHFFGAAAGAMRRILIDHARARSADKRKGERVGLTAVLEIEGTTSPSRLLEIEEVLEKLAVVEPRLVRVVECRYFAGLTLEETAEALGVSDRTVSDDWRVARAWLRRALGA